MSGTLSGGLCLWRGRNCYKAVADAHFGAIEVLAAGNARGGVMASGGRDGKVGACVLYSAENGVRKTEENRAQPQIRTGLRRGRVGFTSNPL